MEIKTPMVFVKHITAAQRGNAASIQFLCDHTSGQFVKICREYDLTNSEIEAVLAKAYGLIFGNIQSLKKPQNFMSWASDLVRGCCEEIAQSKPVDTLEKIPVTAVQPVAEPPAVTEQEVQPAAETTEVEQEVQPAAETTEAEQEIKPTSNVSDAKVAATVAAGWAIAETGSVFSSAPAAGATTGIIPTQAPDSSDPEQTGPTRTESEAAAVKQVKPTAFYDVNAYAEPTSVFVDDITYADDTPKEPVSEDKRIIPVDELVYHPEASYYSSDAPQPYHPEAPIAEEVPDAVQAEIPAVEQSVYAAPRAEAPAETPVTEEPVHAASSYTSQTYAESVHAADEPDVDLVETEEPSDGIADTQGSSYESDEIDVSDSEYDEEDEGDEEEIQNGLALRTKILIGLLCVFIFGACVGVGYAISKGMTANSDPISSQPDRSVETEAPTPEVTVTEIPDQSSYQSEIESAENDRSEDVESTETTDTADAQTTESTGSQSTDAAGSQSTESSASEPVAPAGEVTARADLGTYLGETFASVLRDYPDIARSVYRGELSCANAFIGFIGSYDATQPVSSTIVESVSLLSEAENYNINGFYVGMTSADAESLAAAGEYTELEMTAESSREYVDVQGNILTLTIDSGIVKNVTLRLETADDVTMQVADSISE